jgi:hypothetical protein
MKPQRNGVRELARSRWLWQKNSEDALEEMRKQVKQDAIQF